MMRRTSGRLLRAMGLALRSVFQPGVFWHLLWPVLVAAVLWLVAGFVGISPLADVLMHLLQQLPLVGSWFSGEGSWSHLLANGAIELLLWLALLPLIVATAIVLLSALGLPLMIERVAGSDYADLAQHHGGTQWGSLKNALWAFVIFLLLLVASLPLWLIPGVGAVIAALLSAWMNKRCLCYDALMAHADAQELVRVPRENTGSLWLLAVLFGALSLVPVLNLLVPAWMSLAFVHYLLMLLRERRLTLL